MSAKRMLGVSKGRVARSLARSRSHSKLKDEGLPNVRSAAIPARGRSVAAKAIVAAPARKVRRGIRIRNPFGDRMSLVSVADRLIGPVQGNAAQPPRR